MGWVYVGMALAVPLVIAVVGDVVARKNGRPARIDSESIKAGRKRLKGRGREVGRTRQQPPYS